jgi:hypothetical protein
VIRPPARKFDVISLASGPNQKHGPRQAGTALKQGRSGLSFGLSIPQSRQREDTPHSRIPSDQSFLIRQPEFLAGAMMKWFAWWKMK